MFFSNKRTKKLLLLGAAQDDAILRRLTSAQAQKFFAPFFKKEGLPSSMRMFRAYQAGAEPAISYVAPLDPT